MNTIKKFFAAAAVLSTAVASALTINGIDATGRGHLYDLGWAYAGGIIELSSTEVDAYRFVVDSSADTPISAIGVKAYDCHLPNCFEIEIKDGIFTESFGMNRLDSNLAARVSLKIDGGTFNCRHDPFLENGGYPAADYSLCDEYLSRSAWHWPFALDLFKDSVTIEISGGDFAFDPTPYVQAGKRVSYDGIWWHVESVPKLFDKKDDTPFAGNTTYTGWVRGADGGIKGTIVVKTGKPKKDGTSKPTVAYTPLDGGKKQPVKIPNDKFPVAGGTPLVELPGVGIVKFGGETLAGVGIDVQAAVDRSKSKKSADKKRLESKAGFWNFALATAQGYAAFSVSVNAKGKGKLSGTLPDGTKISVSAQGVLGEKALAIPFSFSKKGKGTLGFVFWVRDDNTAAVSDETSIKTAATTLAVEGIVAPAHISALGNGEHLFSLWLSEGWSASYALKVEGMKWSPDFRTNVCDDGSIPHGLKLKFTPKSGSVKGSFSLTGAYMDCRGKYTVNGVVVGSKFYGSASSKAGASFAVTAE